jgi:hypothetical protein
MNTLPFKGGIDNFLYYNDENQHPDPLSKSDIRQLRMAAAACQTIAGTIPISRGGEGGGAPTYGSGLRWATNPLAVSNLANCNVPFSYDKSTPRHTHSLPTKGPNNGAQIPYSHQGIPVVQRAVPNFNTFNATNNNDKSPTRPTLATKVPNSPRIPHSPKGIPLVQSARALSQSNFSPPPRQIPFSFLAESTINPNLGEYSVIIQNGQSVM